MSPPLLSTGSITNESTYLEVIRYTLYAVALLTTLGIGETLRRLYNIEKKQDQQAASRLLKSDFDAWINGPFKEWKEGRDGPDGLWHAINHHAHDTQGRVTKT